MPEDKRDREHIFLGIVIGVIFFLLLRKEVCGLARRFSASANGKGNDAGMNAISAPGCGCGCSGASDPQLPTNPGTSPGTVFVGGATAFHGSGGGFTEVGAGSGTVYEYNPLTGLAIN